MPYLNSSLFEMTALEVEAVRINSMKDRFELPLYARTVLKDGKGKRRTGILCDSWRAEVNSTFP